MRFRIFLYRMRRFFIPDKSHLFPEKLFKSICEKHGVGLNDGWLYSGKDGRTGVIFSGNLENTNPEFVKEIKRTFPV